jgi:hypothetical protein
VDLILTHPKNNVIVIVDDLHLIPLHAITIFLLDGSQDKRVIKFDLCNRHMVEVEEFCRNENVT